MKHGGTREHMAVMSHESCHDHLNCIHHESRPKTDGDGDWWTHIREQFYLNSSDVLRCVSETEQINCIHTHNTLSRERSVMYTTASNRRLSFMSCRY